jgi:hypothetical protein
LVGRCWKRMDTDCADEALGGASRKFEGEKSAKKGPMGNGRAFPSREQTLRKKAVIRGQRRKGKWKIPRGRCGYRRGKRMEGEDEKD